MKPFFEIDKKKKLLDSYRPFPTNTLKSIRESIFLDWTYNSNAIEGNTLTLSETKVVLEDGITIGGKTLKEHLEVINHREAILYIEEIVRRQEDFSEWQIKNIHKLILKGIDDDNAGVYRKENVLISGAVHVPPNYVLVPEQMEQLVKWYDNSEKLHPVERAAILHIIFVKIHPFVDGNGRTARLLLNLELMKAGYPPIIIRKEERLEYYNSLDKAHTADNSDDFTKLVIDALNRSLDMYIKLL